MATCAACKRAIDPSEKAARDKKGRVFHRSCAKRLMEKQRAKRDAEKARAEAAAVGTIPLDDDAGAMADLLGDVVQPEAAGRPCPSCGSPVASDAVLCTGCGYNFETGASIKTVAKAAPTGARAVAGEAAGSTAAWGLAAVGSCIGGAIGAAVWAAIAYFVHFEVGYVAIGVGFLAGLGAAIGARDRAGVATGLIAAVVAIVAVVAGKFTATSLEIADMLGDLDQTIAAEATQPGDDWMTVDEAVLELVDDEALRREQAGERLDWPHGISGWDEAFELEHYPRDIVRTHRSAFEGLTPEQTTAKIDAIHRENMLPRVADDIAVERESLGESLAWPPGMTYDEAYELEHYPSDVVAQAGARWDGMTREQQHEYMVGGLAEFRAMLGSSEGTARVMAASYSGKDFLFDALWVILAAGAAFGAGRGGAE
ncbi:MAG: zinc ribbon domain-containing protein [Planctomycetota bacterium]